MGRQHIKRILLDHGVTHISGALLDALSADGLEAADENARLRAENERLAKALDPFARAAAIQPPGAENWLDDKPNPEFLPKLWPDWGDFRRAHQALQEGSRHE